MSFPLSSGIAVPDEGSFVKHCSKCKQPKPKHRFSLKKGLHSNERKSFCIDCESVMKRAAKYGVTIEVMESLFRLPCSVCGSEKTTFIDSNKDTGRVKGVLCNDCKTLIQKSDKIIKAKVYAEMRERFPFLLIELIKFRAKEAEPYHPLIDWIENEAD